MTVKWVALDEVRGAWRFAIAQRGAASARAFKDGGQNSAISRQARMAERRVHLLDLLMAAAWKATER